MRNILNLVSFLAILLTACGHAANTPIPLPPTLTPTPAPRYYPTVSPDVRQAMLYAMNKPFGSYYQEAVDENGKTHRFIMLTAVSSGETATTIVSDWTVDVAWVYERNAAGVAYYPLVIGVQEGEQYQPYYTRYALSQREAYLAYLAEREILKRGRVLYASVAGNFVSPGEIDWRACGETLFCRLGRYMQERFGLDHLVIAQLAQQFPEGWMLAWEWDAATEENTSPDAWESIFVTLP